MPWSVIAIVLSGAALYLLHQSRKAERENFERFEQWQKEEAEQDDFLNQVRSYLSETRPFEG
jgi:hypothetical protein